MAPSKIRKVIGAVKDHTSIGMAKVSGSTSSIAALEVAVVKATRHEEHPPEDRHISEILSLTSYSHSLVSACVAIIARRLDRTKNWVVALKALILVHRLLAKGDRAYEQEIFFWTRHGTRFLNMSDFWDASNSSYGKSCDYSVFVRMYALYLDEWLEFRMQGRRGKRGGYGRDEEEEGGRHEMVMAGPTPVREMKIESVFSRAHHLKQLLERFLACRPTGAAKHNRVCVVALHPIVKESFQLYYDVAEIMGTLTDRFMQLDVPDMVRAHEIFSRMSKQLDELDIFYDWCKTARVIRSSECPRLEKISYKKLQTMDDFIQQKLAMLQNGRSQCPDPKPELESGEETVKEMSLVPSKGFFEDEMENELEEKTEIKGTVKKGQEIGDLLNLGEDITSTGPWGDELALALFDDGGIREITTTNKPWVAFKDSSDWETALVQSASPWSNQKQTSATFTGGFDTMMLDSMYLQGGVNTTFPSTGSASSVVTLGRPAAVLALPAPPGDADSLGDPFAASLEVAPPVYVEMSEMEKKQRLLVEEQLVWQQYAKGQVGLTNVQQSNPYPYVAMR